MNQNSLFDKGGKGGKDALPAKRSLLDDVRVRLVLSVLGAVVCWVIVTIAVQPGTTVTLTNVPVDFSYDSTSYTSKGLSIVNAPSQLVSLTVSGDGYTIGDMTADDFVVYPDYSSVMSSGEKNLRLRVRCLSADADSISVTIAGASTTVKVVFDMVEEKILPINIIKKDVTIEEGYILYGTAATAEEVTLSGPSGELDNIVSCEAEVSYRDEMNSTQTVQARLRFLDENGKEITFDYVTADRDTVDVTMTVYKLAELPVTVNFINKPQNFDDSVLQYVLSQDTLTVAGPEAAIDALSTLSIGTIDLSTFMLNKVYDMPVSLPNGIVCQENISTITVSFDCSQLATQTFNLPPECVQVVNLPATYALTVESQRLMNVVLCGPKDALEALTAEQVVAQINANNFSIVMGQQNIACSIYVPSDGRIFALGNYMVQCRIEANTGTSEPD
jgi:YbbR domain-containing protein